MHVEVQRIVDNIERVIIGKTEVAKLSIVALLSNGHILLEDVPGVGKTMLVRALAKSVGAEFKRIQFTPDLLPTDIMGLSIYNPQTLQFEFHPGPIMANIVLADEINRTSPKTQAALLESMEEASVTIDGKTIQMSKPFLVMATQNPVEYEGTYPLPEAQLDRFLLKVEMGYPTPEQEIEVLRRMQAGHMIEQIEAVISLEQLRTLQHDVQQVYIDHSIQHYIVHLAQATRKHPAVFLGVSPRSSIALMKAAQAYAFIMGRDFVNPDDVQYLLPYVFGHRIILQEEAKYEGVTLTQVLRDVTASLAVPIGKVE